MLSRSKSVIAAGGNLQHVDGSFNNGLDKELAVDKQSNEHVVIEKVGDQEINVNNSSYDVTTSKKIFLGLKTNQESQLQILMKKWQRCRDYLIKTMT